MKKQVAMLAALFLVGGVGSALAIEETNTSTGSAGAYDSQSAGETPAGESNVGVTQEEQQQDQQQVATAEQERIDFQAANDISGLPLLDEQGQQIGEVDQVLVDLDRGELAYVVVTKGGVLGIGGDKYVVPWKAIKTDSQQQGLVVTAKSDDLKAVEAEGEVRNQIDRQMGQEIHQYYGVSPYWEEGQQQQDRMEQSIEGGAEK